jgi:hypothetical protein
VVEARVVVEVRIPLEVRVPLEVGLALEVRVVLDTGGVLSVGEVVDDAAVVETGVVEAGDVGVISEDKAEVVDKGGVDEAKEVADALLVQLLTEEIIEVWNVVGARPVDVADTLKVQAFCCRRFIPFQLKLYPSVPFVYPRMRSLADGTGPADGSGGASITWFGSGSQVSRYHGPGSCKVRPGGPH